MSKPKESKNVARKITVKGICGKLDFDQIYRQKNVPLMRIVGIAGKQSPGATEYGTYIRFGGSFRATNLQTGEVTIAGSAILPGVAQDFLAGAIDSAPEGAKVEFAFDIGARYDAEAATKYVFTVTPLIELSENDPLMLLEAKATGNVRTLPKPEPKAEPEPEAEAEAKVHDKKRARK